MWLAWKRENWEILWSKVQVSEGQFYEKRLDFYVTKGAWLGTVDMTTRITRDKGQSALLGEREGRLGRQWTPNTGAVRAESKQPLDGHVVKPTHVLERNWLAFLHHQESVSLEWQNMFLNFAWFPSKSKFRPQYIDFGTIVKMSV